MANYKVAVSEMCNVFEDGLAQFLKNLRSSSKAPREEKHQHSNRTRGRKKRCTRNTVGNGDNEMGMNIKATDPISKVILQKGDRNRDQIDEILPSR